MADPNPGQPGSAPTAGAEELSIPKHRFDEVNNELRRLREEVGMKDRLYMEDRQRAAQQQRPQQPESTPEESGLDPAVHNAVLKMATKIADSRIAREREQFSQQIGFIANKLEKTELIAAKGADKAKYLVEIESMQQDQLRRTGAYLPAEIALEMIQSREKDQRIRALEAQLAGGIPPAQNPPPPSPAPPQGGVPSAAGTRQIPGGAPVVSPAGATFGQLTLEEMEARLDAGFKSGSAL